MPYVGPDGSVKPDAYLKSGCYHVKPLEPTAFVVSVILCACLTFSLVTHPGNLLEVTQCLLLSENSWVLLNSFVRNLAFPIPLNVKKVLTSYQC